MHCQWLPPSQGDSRVDLRSCLLCLQIDRSSHSAFAPILNCLQLSESTIDGYNKPPVDVFTAFESTRQHSESFEFEMKVTLSNIQVELL